ncbi:hypothetical protein DENSPDRAFT_696034 [Dentipellis sp. KUC8613]|nr:hypothetical protein DENSPDRAFT_696034 [Dentipellis sp. KUC8613]
MGLGGGGGADGWDGSSISYSACGCTILVSRASALGLVMMLEFVDFVRAENGSLRRGKWDPMARFYRPVIHGYPCCTRQHHDILFLDKSRRRLSALGRYVRQCTVLRRLKHSVIFIDTCVRNFSRFTGCSLGEAIKCATFNPARYVYGLLKK